MRTFSPTTVTGLISACILLRVEPCNSLSCNPFLLYLGLYLTWIHLHLMLFLFQSPVPLIPGVPLSPFFDNIVSAAPVPPIVPAEYPVIVFLPLLLTLRRTRLLPLSNSLVGNKQLAAIMTSLLHHL